MKKIGFLLIIILSVTTITYGQKVISITEKTTVYNIIDPTESHVLLKDLCDFKENTLYSGFNENIIADRVVDFKNGNILYYLLDEKDIDHYKKIRFNKNKKMFVKKYGKIYIHNPIKNPSN